MSDYSSERYDPQLEQCTNNEAVVTLDFDGKRLRMIGEKTVYTYPAVSGRMISGGFDYSVENQKQKNKGPIPEGQFWIRPDELWENAWYKLTAPTSAWGNYRISIHPFPSTETYKRGGFFIHGGDVPGSAGCIDLTGQMDQFVKDLKGELKGRNTCQIRLDVNYQGPGDFVALKQKYA